MGHTASDGAVVDADGRVHGTDRLTIADVSIVPNGPSAFSYIPAVMLAEQLSERIAAAISIDRCRADLPSCSAA
jgi:choline dehydrogenase-like flavoprotein